MKGKGTFRGGCGREKEDIDFFPALVKILLMLFRARAASLIEVDSVNCERGSFNFLLRVRREPSLFRLNSRCRET